jgi:hypothetical protein
MRFEDTSPLSFALPLALYFTWWYAPAFSVGSSTVLLIVGTSPVLAALRGSAGCEPLSFSKLAAAPLRPDRLRRLHASRYPGAARAQWCLKWESRAMASSLLIGKHLLRR